MSRSEYCTCVVADIFKSAPMTVCRMHGVLPARVGGQADVRTRWLERRLADEMAYSKTLKGLVESLLCDLSSDLHSASGRVACTRVALSRVTRGRS